MLGQCR